MNRDEVEGRKDNLKGRIKEAAGTLTGNADLTRLVKDASDGNLWVVARFDVLSAAGNLPAGVAERLPALNWVTLTGHINGGIRAAVKAEARDDAAAKNLRDVVQGMLALAKLQTGQRTDIAAIMDSIELGGDGKTVSLALSIPIEVVDHLASLRTPGRLTPPPDAPEPPQAPEPPAVP